MWSISLGAIGAAVTGIILANTDLFLSKAEKASLQFLAAIDLKTLGEGKNTISSGNQKRLTLRGICNSKQKMNKPSMYSMFWELCCWGNGVSLFRMLSKI